MNAPPTVTIVIFGGAGDLAHRKLLPALYNLHVDHLLPPTIAIVGIGRRDQSDGAYHASGRIRFRGMHYRRDIGAKCLKRYNNKKNIAVMVVNES